MTVKKTVMTLAAKYRQDYCHKITLKIRLMTSMTVMTITYIPWMQRHKQPARNVARNHQASTGSNIIIASESISWDKAKGLNPSAPC